MVGWQAPHRDALFHARVFKGMDGLLSKPAVDGCCTRGGTLCRLQELVRHVCALEVTVRCLYCSARLE